MIEVETEIPRGRELALPVTHGGAVEGEGVDVPDVGLGGPLLVQPELLLPPDVVEDWRPAGAMLGDETGICAPLEGGGDQGGQEATISPTSSSHRLDTLLRRFALLGQLLSQSSGSLSKSARSDSSELSPSRSSSTEKVKRCLGTE